MPSRLGEEVEKILGPFYQLALDLFYLEIGTFGGRLDILVLLLVFTLLVIPPLFRVFSGWITAVLAKLVLKIDPEPYLPRSTSKVKDVIVFIGSFLASVFSIWWARL